MSTKKKKKIETIYDIGIHDSSIKKHLKFITALSCFSVFLLVL